MNRPARIIAASICLSLSLFLAACQNAPAVSSQPAPEATTEEPTENVSTPIEETTVSETQEPSTETSDPTGTIEPTTEAVINDLTYPASWEDMPVVPEISDRARAVYAKGIEMGRDPHAFSIVGDCQNVSAYFLEDFAHPGQYNLGDYPHLQHTIDQFFDSFARERAAVKGGYNVASVLSPLWSDPKLCDSHESPLECEFRLNNPSIVLISMETWWYDRPASTYADYMRKIVEFSIEQGVVPILATKADNLEGDNSINAAIVQVAQEYQMPLWNFWAAVQPLPGHGLEDGFHLTYARPMFDNPATFEAGWGWRNLTALQAIDAVWRGVDPNAPQN